VRASLPFSRKNLSERRDPTETGSSVKARENGPGEYGFEKWFRNFPIISVGKEKEEYM